MFNYVCVKKGILKQDLILRRKSGHTPLFMPLKDIPVKFVTTVMNVDPIILLCSRVF